MNKQATTDSMYGFGYAWMLLIRMLGHHVGHTGLGALGLVGILGLPQNPSKARQGTGGMAMAVTINYKNHPVWKAVFSQFQSLDERNKYIPETVCILNRDVANIRKESLLLMKQFVREAIDGTKRIRPLFRFFLGTVPHLIPWGQGSGGFTE